MSIYSATQGIAQIVLPTRDLNADVDFFKNLGFRLDNIFPADDPQVAMISGFNLHIRIDKNEAVAPGIIHIQSDMPRLLEMQEKSITAPNGTILKFFPKTIALEIPETQHKFEIRKMDPNDSWVIGRAGMLYRDLIPDRLGGSIIASHIHIPQGGPVPDMVHYHTIGFQLIFCYKGWVKLVYEDQGPPFILNAGDCVTQPPEIRHRVLESSDNLEVIEIGVPSDHLTTIDHEMELPTTTVNRDRLYQGQKFCHHKVADAVWKPWEVKDFEYRDTGVSEATDHLASVQVIRSMKSIHEDIKQSHSADILFRFVMKGSLQIAKDGKVSVLNSGDAFVMPPQVDYEMSKVSDDLTMLEVKFPGNSQLE